MIQKLRSDFKLESLGLSVRLVDESDVDYILSLRTNKHLTRFIHHTDNDREKQIEWIRNYKERETEGREYYFIYFLNEKPVGLNRIYNIFEYYGTIGSWICNPGNEPEPGICLRHGGRGLGAQLLSRVRADTVYAANRNGNPADCDRRRPRTGRRI